MMTSDRQLPERAAKASAALRVIDRVVVELELAALPDGVGKTLAGALAAQIGGDVDAEVSLHLVAQREHVLGADALGRRLEQPVVEQAVGGGVDGTLAHAARSVAKNETARTFIGRPTRILPARAGAGPMVRF